jgi:hypothetical protein
MQKLIGLLRKSWLKQEDSGGNEVLGVLGKN